MENEIYYDLDSNETNPKSGKTGFAVTSLVLGIVALVCCCCGLGYIAAPLSLIFGIISLVSHRGGKGMAIAGVILSSLTVVALIFISIVYGPYMKDYFRFAMNAETIIKNYEEDGELPDFLEKYNDPKYDDFWKQSGYDDFDDFFNDIIKSVKQSGGSSAVSGSSKKSDIEISNDSALIQAQ